MPNAGSQPPTRFRRWKRTVILALLLLAGGAVVNVAVAWGAAKWIEIEPRDSIRAPTMRDAAWWNKAVADHSTDRVGAVVVLQDAWPLTIYMALSDQGGRLRVEDAWMIFDFAQPYTEWTGVHEARIGVPMRTAALYSVNVPPTAAQDPSVKVSGTVRFQIGRPPGRMVLNWDQFDRVAVLWPGFIINTLLYAVILWLLVATPITARRMLRRRRGLCEKCAYPIGISSVCTECGAAVPAGRR